MHGLQNTCWTWEWFNVVVSQQFAGIRFWVWLSKPSAHISFHDLDVKIGTLVVDVVESTNVIESTDVRDSSGESCWTCWNESGSSWLVWSLVSDVRDRWRDGSVTGDTRRPWPRPSPSVYPVNWVESTVGSFGQYIYWIACWRDRRSRFEAYFCFYYSFIL